jgi:ATP-dependent helicase/nuclease subunit A
VGPWIARAASCPNWAHPGLGQSGVWQCWIYEENDPRLAVPSGTDRQNLPHLDGPFTSDGPATDALVRRLSWAYPFPGTNQPAKLSVSNVQVGILAAAEDEKHGARFQQRPVRKRGSLGAAAIGTAHHVFLQNVSLDSVQDIAALHAEAQQLESKGLLSCDERRSLDLEAVAAFWRSSEGRQILAQREYLFRELDFTLRLSLAELEAFRTREAGALTHHEMSRQLCSQVSSRTELQRGQTDDEFIVLTGAVDLAVLRPEDIWLLDFKTDAVDANDWKAKARTYGPQLQLYSLALNRIYKRPVTRAWLHSLPLRESLEWQRI